MILPMNIIVKNLRENIFEHHFVKQNALALGIVLTVQGIIPFINGRVLSTANNDL